VFTSVKNPLVIDNRSSNITKEQAYKLFSNGDYNWFYEEYLPFFTKSKGLSKEELIKKYVDDMSGVRGFDKEVLQNIKRSYNQDKSYDKMMSDVAGILGKDGVIEKVSDGLSVYVAFTPNQIKSATENIGTFSTQDDRIQFQKIDREIINGFYSPIEDRVSTFKQPKASVQKWKEIVGIKSDEAVFSGLSDWLNSMKPERQLPKEEVVQFIKDNRITIEE
jgi:ADP-Ribosyltransferase in polyvalent proteins